MRPSMVIYPLRQIYYSWSVSNRQYFGYLVGVTGGCDVTDTLLVGSYLHKLGLLSHNIFFVNYWAYNEHFKDTKRAC